MLKTKTLQEILITLFMILTACGIPFSGIAMEPDNRNQIERIIQNKDYSLDLSPREQHWLKQHPFIRLGIDRAFPPFGSITKNREYIGFSADIMRIIENRLHIRFKIFKDAPWDKTLEMARAGEIDMISALVDTTERRQFLNFTKPYIDNPTIIINNAIKHGYIGSIKNLEGKKVAIEKGSYSAAMLEQAYPDIILLPVENTSLALSLVSIGKADAYVGNGVTASYLIRKLGFHNLSFSGQTPYSSSHSIGIVKPNEILTNIINKTIASISTKDIDAIANYWFGMNTHPFISKSTAIAIGAILGGLLLLSVLWTLSLKRAKNALHKSQETIKHQAEVDYLTGLGNRRKFYQVLNEQIALSDKQARPFSLFYLDLDLFKDVNDNFGHTSGDKLLKVASRRINACIERGFGFTARIGGDEFMIILPGISDKKIIRKTLDCINQSLAKPFMIDGNKIHISVSIGVTLYPNDAQNAQQLVINGDQAMYHAKQKGRNCHAFFNKAMQREAQYKSNLLNDLRKAVEENQFSIQYQPIIDLASGKIAKAEALVRWHHPKRGLVSPEEFIPLAEESGLICEIGEWILREAIKQTGEICREYNPDFQMSINTSPLQYRSQKKGLDISLWRDALERHGVSGNNIVVEITEGMLMENHELVQERLMQLKQLNIGVAIDDFGTGYSSLAYLKKLDVNFLKIDQSFVKNLVTDPDDDVLVQTIILMAHQLGLKVIAEGIENNAQQNLLIKRNCDYGQGFLYSKPLDGDAFKYLLKKSLRLKPPMPH